MELVAFDYITKKVGCRIDLKASSKRAAQAENSKNKTDISAAKQ